MTDEPIRGPGRPRKQAVPLRASGVAPEPKPVAAPAPKAEVIIETADGPVKRRRRASVGGHALKLDAPNRPGFKRRWFNDDGNRLADAHELGYDPVHDPEVKTSDLGSGISRLVGTKANGEPLRAYLMETPDELHAEGVAEKEARNRLVDDAIVAGFDSTGQMSSRETYGHGEIKRD
jgi:hypothetical protein